MWLFSSFLADIFSRKSGKDKDKERGDILMSYTIKWRKAPLRKVCAFDWASLIF